MLLDEPKLKMQMYRMILCNMCHVQMHNCIYLYGINIENIKYYLLMHGNIV